MGLFNKEKLKPFIIYCDPIEFNGITVWCMNQPNNQYGSLCYNNDHLCFMITWPLFPASKTIVSFGNNATIITDYPSNKLKLIQIGTYTGDFWTETKENKRENIRAETIPILSVIKSDDDYTKIDSLELCKKTFGDEIEYKKFE